MKREALCYIEVPVGWLFQNYTFQLEVGQVYIGREKSKTIYMCGEALKTEYHQMDVCNF